MTQKYGPIIAGVEQIRRLPYRKAERYSGKWVWTIQYLANTPSGALSPTTIDGGTFTTQTKTQLQMAAVTLLSEFLKNPPVALEWTNAIEVQAISNGGLVIAGAGVA